MIKGKQVKDAHENKTQHTLHGRGKQFSERQGLQKPVWNTHSNGFVSLRPCAALWTHHPIIAFQSFPGI